MPDPLIAALGFIAALTIPSVAHAQTPLTGDWDVAVTSPQGTTNLTATIKQEADKLSGSMTTPFGDVPLRGSITDGVVTCAFTVNVQGMSVEIAMTGRVDGDAITGTARFGDISEGPFTAKRSVTPGASSARTGAGRPTNVPVSADAGAAAGDWELAVTTPQGPMMFGATLTQDGDKLAGMFHGPMGDLPLKGTLDGRVLKLTFTVAGPQGELSGALSGELDGDAINKGTADLGPFGTLEWTGKRSKK